MILLLEIGLIVWGIIILVKGQVALSPNRVVRGAAARIVGVFLLLPLPLAFATGIVMGFMMVAQGKRLEVEELRATGFVVEVSILLGCIFVALLIACFTSTPRKRKPPPEEEIHEVEA